MIIRKMPTGSFRFAVLGLLAIALPACTDAAGYDLDYIMGKAPFIGTMRATVSIEPQVMPRLPAPGSQPYIAPNGVTVPAFTQSELDSFAAGLTNPLPPTPEVLARGAVVYEHTCFVCHGEAGAGSGPIVGAGKFPMGPALTTAAAAGRSDGYYYGIMRVGRGLMPPYGDRVGEGDRWAVAHYLRQIQAAAGVVAAAPVVAPAAGQ